MGRLLKFIRFPLQTFLAGLFTVGQFSFLGNYLPRVYPVHLRGTGEGFAANIPQKCYIFGKEFTRIGLEAGD